VLVVGSTNVGLRQRVQNAIAVLDSQMIYGGARQLAQMRDQCERWERAGDRRCVFLSCYATMTANMLAALEAGRFRDGDLFELGERERLVRILHLRGGNQS